MSKELISNVAVYGVEESIKASKYPMSTDTERCTNDITPTVKALWRCKTGTGHDNFLNGFIVQFDLTFTIKAWTEAERYHFFDFVSSQSTMHRVVEMDVRSQCNEYVTENTIKEVDRLKAKYFTDGTLDSFLALLYNIPVGFRLTARMTTNYRQLKTIYQQRKKHKLPEWREFCKWCESLPYFKEICVDMDG